MSVHHLTRNYSEVNEVSNLQSHSNGQFEWEKRVQMIDSQRHLQQKQYNNVITFSLTTKSKLKLSTTMNYISLNQNRMGSRNLQQPQRHYRHNHHYQQQHQTQATQVLLNRVGLGYIHSFHGYSIKLHAYKHYNFFSCRLI